MLDRLRASKGGLVTWLFLGAIIIVFVISFGPGSFSKSHAGCGGAPAYAAKVNGQTITLATFERQYQSLLRLYQAQMGPAFSRDLADQLGLPQQALDATVNSALVSQEATRRGLMVSDDELGQVIRSDPSFHDGGKFDRETYNRVTSEMYGSAHRFEETMREQLLAQRILAAVEQTVKVSPAEVRERWEMLSDRAELTFVLFPTAAVRADVKLTDADVKAFQTAQAARIEAYYKEHPERFDQKKKVRVRHVLAKVDPSHDDAAAKKKIEEARQRLEKGESFEKVAATLSDDVNTKDRGGDLGFVSEGLADEAFVKAALALEPGKLSEPVRSAAGWHVLRVEEVVPAKQVSLDQARPEIARDLLTDERAVVLAHEKAQTALTAARGGKALTALFPTDEKSRQMIGGQPVVAQDSGPFSTALSFVPKIGEAPELIRDTAAANQGDVLPKVYDTPAGAVVAQVKTRERPDQAKFAEQQADITRRLRGEKAAQVQQGWLAELRAKATIEENPALLAPRTPRAVPE